MADVYIDLDGTLTDPLEGIGKSILYALEKLGAPTVDDETLRSYIGRCLDEAADRCTSEREAWHRWAQTAPMPARRASRVNSHEHPACTASAASCGPTA